MRSRSNPAARIAVLALALLAAEHAGARAADHADYADIPMATAAQPDKAEIEGALEKVKADPNLATERKIKTLRWKESSSKASPTPGWLKWLAGLFRWIGESTRVLIWIGAAALAGMVAVYLARVLGTRLAAPEDAGFVVPTHVRDLDIRPETLPADIGAAARQLWERGAQRAALALLYRGMLSRLAHVHGVPIRDSSTEGDCLALATATLPDRSDYVGRLVRVWQRFGYGRQNVEAEAVYSLCDEFDAALRARTT